MKYLAGLLQGIVYGVILTIVLEDDSPKCQEMIAKFRTWRRGRQMEMARDIITKLEAEK